MVLCKAVLRYAQERGFQPKIFDKEKLAIADLFLICAKLSFPLMLVGAGARILIFDKPYGVTGRTTTDWDWGVKVASWSDFEMLTREMTAPPAALFKKTRVFHRFEHIATKTLLDLIPFGEITRPDHLLSWPDEPDLKMNVLAYEESFECSQTIVLDNEIAIKVVNLPAFLVLKLIAWQDRKAEKDLKDVALVLQKFSDAEKVYETFGEQLINGEMEFEDASIFYLGREIKQVFPDYVLNRIEIILGEIIEGNSRYLPGLLDRYAENWDLEFDALLRCFEILRGAIL